MFIYNIPMKFRYAEEGLNYSAYEEELNKAKDMFNIQAQKMKKARRIIEVICEEGGFVLMLESKDALTNPSKALAVYSKELAKMEALVRLKDAQNHLLCNNGIAFEVEQEEKEFYDTTDEIFKIVIDIFMGGNIADDPFVVSGRKKAQETIREVCKEFYGLKSRR